MSISREVEHPCCGHVLEVAWSPRWAGWVVIVPGLPGVAHGAATGRHPSQGDSGISPQDLTGHSSEKGPQYGSQNWFDVDPSEQGLF